MVLSTTGRELLVWFRAGEANSGRAEQYACQIAAMVEQWRTQFHQHSMQQTAADFPFGYIQVPPLCRWLSHTAS